MSTSRRRAVGAIVALICATILPLSGCSLIVARPDPSLVQSVPLTAEPTPTSASWPKVDVTGSSSTTIDLHVPKGATHFIETFNCTPGTIDYTAGVALREDPDGPNRKPCVMGPFIYTISVSSQSVEHLDVTLPAGEQFTLTGYYTY